jgi:hypothetical protein
METVTGPTGFAIGVGVDTAQMILDLIVLGLLPCLCSRFATTLRITGQTRRRTPGAP